MGIEALAKHLYTKDLIRAYGTAFQKIAMSMASESMSDLSFLDHGDVVRCMPRMQRKAVAEIVLTCPTQHNRSWSHLQSTGSLHPSDIPKLLKEVEKGACAIVFGEHCRPVRIANIVVLQLNWPSFGGILAQLAKVTEMETVPKCQLP